ncbi:hypothetical protein V2J09_016681 [Rumex salicifolius]
MNGSGKSTSFNRTTSSTRRAANSGSSKFDPNLHIYHKDLHVSDNSGWISLKFYAAIILVPLITFLLAISCGYLCVFPDLGKHPLPPIMNWVPDDSYPLYNSSECPFVEQGFNCLGNGRNDQNYLKWRWRPNNCDTQRFNVSDMLEKHQGKRISFVGDSMSRTQWESMICMFMTGVKDRTSVQEINGNKISKTIRYLGVHFSSFNFTIEFFSSVFLVQSGSAPKHGPKRVKSTLKLDKMDDISKDWIRSDVLIFNTGHWWVPSKLFDSGCFFQLGGSLMLGMSIQTAFRTALITWASWVDSKIETNRTRVFFRTFEPSHWSNTSESSCKVSQFPMSGSEGDYKSGFSDNILDVVSNMSTLVTVLGITSMSALRGDAHVGAWSGTTNQSVADCSHWCLPGVPDVWNEILLQYLSCSSLKYSQCHIVYITFLAKFLFTPSI